MIKNKAQLQNIFLNVYKLTYTYIHVHVHCTFTRLPGVMMMTLLATGFLPYGPCLIRVLDRPHQISLEIISVRLMLAHVYTCNIHVHVHIFVIIIHYSSPQKSNALQGFTQTHLIPKEKKNVRNLSPYTHLSLSLSLTREWFQSRHSLSYS